jgi:hypothetical protein
MAGKGRGQKIQFQHGWKEVWSIKSVSALLEMGVVKSKFQYGWIGAWSIQSVSAWLERGLVKKTIVILKRVGGEGGQRDGDL